MFKRVTHYAPRNITIYRLSCARRRIARPLWECATVGLKNLPLYCSYGISDEVMSKHLLGQVQHENPQGNSPQPANSEKAGRFVTA